jgi:transposase InsO family protein
MSHATHANAALTPRARLKMAKLIVDQGWKIPRAAERYDVSWKTAKKWADRYRDDGPAGMLDRSSRPHHQPNRTPVPVVRKIVHLRWKQRLGPVEIADRLGMQSSTVYAVLVRCRLNRLTHIDRATGEPIRRYEHEKPGDLIHVDVKKLGRIPDGGGWRYVGKQQGDKNRSATAVRTGGPKNKRHQPLIGTCYLHTVIDDHSRVAYVEARDDETKETATDVLRNAVTWFAVRGVTVQRVLSDNGSCYKSHLWRDTCAELRITPKKTRHYRPQTNGKIERFHRTLVEGWAFKKFYNSESARLAALQGWVHEYNHHRPHSAIGKAAPITRLDNLAGHHS